MLENIAYPWLQLKLCAGIKLRRGACAFSMLNAALLESTAAAVGAIGYRIDKHINNSEREHLDNTTYIAQTNDKTNE